MEILTESPQTEEATLYDEWVDLGFQTIMKKDTGEMIELFGDDVSIEDRLEAYKYFDHIAAADAEYYKEQAKKHQERAKRAETARKKLRDHFEQWAIICIKPTEENGKIVRRTQSDNFRMSIIPQDKWEIEVDKLPPSFRKMTVPITIEEDKFEEFVAQYVDFDENKAKYTATFDPKKNRVPMELEKFVHCRQSNVMRITNTPKSKD